MRNVLALAALALLCAALPAGARNADSAPGLVLETWLAQARVGGPETHENLRVFPVAAKASSEVPAHLSLDAALKAGALKVGEVSESGSVNEIRVENRGKVPVFLMAGEILTGAKQDRVLQDDLWLPAGSGPVAVACYCVEQGRWSYASGSAKAFEARPVASNVAVRAKARATNDQSAVWSSVAETQSSLGYGGSTALGDTYEAPRVKSDLEGYLKALRGLPERHPEATGFVVAVGDRILAADLFGDRDDALATWPKLLPSYALEAARATQGEKATVGTDEAKAFLRRAAATPATTRATPGEGTLLALASKQVVGSALLLGRAPVHAELFPHTGDETGPVVPPIQRQYQR